MIRRLTLLLLLLVGIQLSWADDATIVIKQKGGNETLLKLSTNPVITFEDESMVVTTSLTQILIPLGDIVEYTVSGAASGIKTIPAVPEFRNGCVVFSDLPPGTPICVHSIDGRLINRHTIDYTGVGTVRIDNLPEGVNVISVLNKTIKIINKRN